MAGPVASVVAHPFADRPAGASLAVALGSTAVWIGGAIAGAICGYVILAPSHAMLPKWASYAAPIAVVVFSVIASVVIAA